jgi:hypothetical protein
VTRRKWTREQLERAHAAAAAAGPSFPIDFTNLLPLLPSSIEQLAVDLAAAALGGAEAAGEGALFRNWLWVPVAKADPRVARSWIEEQVGAARFIRGRGRALVVSMCDGTRAEYMLRLVGPRSDGEWFESHLCGLDGRPVAFATREAAIVGANAVADDFYGWRWLPFAPDPGEEEVNGAWSLHPSGDLIGYNIGFSVTFEGGFDPGQRRLGPLARRAQFGGVAMAGVLHGDAGDWAQDGDVLLFRSSGGGGRRLSKPRLVCGRDRRPLRFPDLARARIAVDTTLCGLG